MSTLKPDNQSKMSGKRPGDLLSTPVTLALKKLGADLALARRRRRLTQESMAERLRISEATVRRMERGDTGISIGTLAQAFYILGELDKITQLLDTASDNIGLSLMNEQLPLRVRRKRIKSDSGAL